MCSKKIDVTGCVCTIRKDCREVKGMDFFFVEPFFPSDGRLSDTLTRMM